MKKSSPSLIMREIQIKIALNSHPSQNGYRQGKSKIKKKQQK
jgi:hypothetical protein